jgi:23S rRNA (adenine2503-C2)-methyltransferase
VSQERQDIYELSPEAFAEWLKAAGEPAYRLKQVLDWLYVKFAGTFEAMTNLPAALRQRLADEFVIGGLRVVDRQVSTDGETEKFLFECADGERVESVLMHGRPHATFCISSQAGCRLGCSFCATGAMGFARNLSTGEILAQVAALARQNGSVGNVVFMGMGEPLLNLDAVIPALEALNDERRFALGARRITVSTAGITAGIQRLAAAKVRPCLALSLNSPFESQRSELMPINRRYPLAEVLDSCAEYGERTGRPLLLEYVMLANTNTSAPAARGVREIATRLGAAVNLIPFNHVEGCGHKPPRHDEVERFRKLIQEHGVTVTQRFRRGRDILAACGQLRGKHATDRPGGENTP